MSHRPGLVIDTSTLIGAVLRPNSVPRQAFVLGIGRYELCVSQATLDELSDVLQRAKFDRYSTINSRLEFFDLVSQHSRLWSVDLASEIAAQAACRDEKDAKFLALALSSQAVAIVSSDADLLVLNPWRGVSILTPAAFVLNSDS